MGRVRARDAAVPIGRWLRRDLHLLEHHRAADEEHHGGLPGGPQRRGGGDAPAPAAADVGADARRGKPDPDQARDEQGRLQRWRRAPTAVGSGRGGLGEADGGGLAPQDRPAGQRIAQRRGRGCSTPTSLFSSLPLPPPAAVRPVLWPAPPPPPPPPRGGGGRALVALPASEGGGGPPSPRRSVSRFATWSVQSSA